MKLLTTFEALGSPTTSGGDANYPIGNLAVTVLDPFLQFRFAQYNTAGGEWIVIDFGSAKSLNCIYFNRCNFPHVHVQGHTSDSWGTPDYDLGCDLVQDECDNRKGFFALSFNKRFMRILVPLAQSLDYGYGSTPAIGNILFGTAATLPAVIEFNANVMLRLDGRQMDGGPENVRKLSRSRYAISGTCEGSLSSIKAIPKNWTQAVLWDEYSADAAWLIWNSQQWSRPYQSGNDTRVQFQFNERP